MKVLGLDPGRHIGVALLDVGARQATVVHLATWDGGADPDELQRLLGGMIAQAAPLVAIERVEHVHGSERMGSGYAEGLCHANWIAGLLAAFALAEGLRVATTDAGTWRRALVGSRVASDAEARTMVRARVPGWPATSNAHERDGAGIALWAGLAQARGRAG